MFRPQLGVSLHTLSTDLTGELMEAIVASRIATLELSARLFEDQARQDTIALLRQRLGNGVRPMTIHALFGGSYDFSVLDEPARQRALAAVDISIDLAVQLNVPMIVMHASAEPVTPSERPQRFERAQAALAEIGERCQKTGQRIAVELLPRTCLGNTVEELL